MTSHSRIHRNVINRKRQKGVSLIELAIWLAIAAAILFGIFIVVGVVQAKRVTTDEARNLTLMASDLRSKFSNQGSFAGLTNASAIQLNLVPTQLITGGNLVSGYGTNITIQSANVNGIANDGFSFTYQVPSKSCSDFVAGSEAAFSEVNIGGTVVKDLGAGDDKLSVADLALCNATATGNANTTVILSQGK